MYKDLVKNKNFMLLAFGGFISGVGDYMYNLAITVSLYNMTKSVGAVAIMWIARGILRIPVQYVAGIFSDRYNKKRIIIITNFTSVFVALSFIMAKGKHIWIAYISAFFLQSLNDFDENAEVALLPVIVKPDGLALANSVFSFLQSISIFLAPAASGIIYKIWGSDILYIINATSFFIASVTFVFINYIHVRKKEVENNSGIIKSGMEGYRILKEHKSIKMLFFISGVYAILGRFYETYKVAIADIILNIGGEGIVYFEYAIAIGGFAVPLIIKNFHKVDEKMVYIVSSIIISVGFCIFGYSHSMVITLITMGIMGVVLNLQGIYFRIIIQKSIEKEYMGRIFSFNKIILTTFALIGLAISEHLYKITNIGNIFLITGAIAVCLCLRYCYYNRI